MERSLLLAVLVVVVLIAVAALACNERRETMCVGNVVHMNVPTPRAPCSPPPAVDYGPTNQGAVVSADTNWDVRAARSVSSMINSVDLSA